MTTDEAARGHSAIPITGVPEADQLLVANPLALLIGMLMDQQVPMGWAFRGPFTLQERLGGSLDAEDDRSDGPGQDRGHLPDKPAMHRYPGSMGKRTRERCRVVVEHYGGDAGEDLARRTTGDELHAVCGSCPATARRSRRSSSRSWASGSVQAAPGWEEAAAPFSDGDAAVGRGRRPPRSPWQRVRELKQGAEGREEGEGRLIARPRGRTSHNQSTRPPTELTAITSIDVVEPFDRAVLRAGDERLSLVPLEPVRGTADRAGRASQHLVELLLLGRLTPAASS